MKYILYIVFLLTCQSACAQDYFDLYRAQYQCAYNYINDINKGEKITVSHTIVDLERWAFIQDLSVFPEAKEKVQSHSIKYVYNRKNDIYSKKITSLGAKRKSSKYIIFFSPIIDNMLVASVIPYNKYKKRFVNDYERMAFQITCDDYLFLFDADMKLIKVLHANIICN